MKSSKWVGATLLLATTNVHSHHSFAMFNDKTPITVSGTVSQFQWTNPHTYIEMDVSDQNGITRRYTVECSSISILRRSGWKPSDLKAGDRITVVMFPLRDGRPGGLMDKVTLPSGRSLGNANDQ